MQGTAAAATKSLPAFHKLRCPCFTFAPNPGMCLHTQQQARARQHGIPHSSIYHVAADVGGAQGAATREFRGDGASSFLSIILGVQM
jgi:hypothetical protein